MIQKHAYDFSIFVNDRTDQPQRMRRGHSSLKIDIGEQRSRPIIAATHPNLRSCLLPQRITITIEARVGFSAAC